MKTKLSICLVFFVLAITVLLTSCVERENISISMPVLADYDTGGAAGGARKNLRIGVVPGPYGDMYMDVIHPLLQPMGYTSQLVFYDDFIQPNFALARGEVDLNIFQHYRYLNDFKMQNDLYLSAIAEIPTASMGIFSNRFQSVNALQRGITASIPNDSTNRARALRVMDAAKIITLNPAIDMARADISDIIENPYNIRFVQLDATALVPSLQTYDISVINGNFAISGGLNLADALYNEVLAENYYNLIAVRTEDLSEQFVRDIISVVRSQRYINMVKEPGGKYAGFQHPRYY